MPNKACVKPEVLFSYSQITAPKEGRIVDRLAEPGDTAQPGKPLLTLYDVQTLRLETPVLERLAVTLRVGQQLNVHVDSIDQDFTATIDEIVPQADAASRSFLVRASLPRSANLFEGMYGRLQIPAGSRVHLCLNTPRHSETGATGVCRCGPRRRFTATTLDQDRTIGHAGSRRSPQWGKCGQSSRAAFAPDTGT